MIITHNMASINTNRQLSINQENASKSLEKLSSGFRINKAGDDAAGLAISEKMRGQIRGLDQASRNSQDGISMIQTAEGSLSETQAILQRMKELATQSANDTNVSADRSEIQKEMNQLSSEVNRIGNTTEFNTKKLLNGGGQQAVVATTNLVAGGQTGQVGAFNQVTASAAEQKGEFKLSVAAGTYTAGATFTVGGESFKVVNGTADAAKGELASGNATDVAKSLAAAINANPKLHERFANTAGAAGTSSQQVSSAEGGTTTTTASDGSGVITLVENTGKAAGGAGATSLPITGAGLSVTTQKESVKEAAGKYTYNLDHAFETAGSKLYLNGVALTAVSSNAGPDQFNISTDKARQAKEIAAAINGNANEALGKRFEATVNGTTLTLTERTGKATGQDLSNQSVAIGGSATAISGKTDVDFKALVAPGGRVTIDGQDIAVTTDASDTRIANGTAMIAGSSIKEQTDNLAAAVNKNTALNAKYVATSNGDKLELTQQAGKETLAAPVVTTNTSEKTGFEAKLQIGANTAQSITLTIGDMRSSALGITSNDPNKTTKTANNGTVASYTAVSNVSNGTTNDNVEYALDVSSHDKATAAISVLDDAIQSVSAQRSQLGAFQNRLEHTIANLGTSSENLTAAESRVRDVDMAKEMMAFQKNNILQQAATAMMAQANQMPQGVLQLLR